MRTIAVFRQYQANRSAGFTLIEVLVCIALLSIVFGTVYRSFANVNRSYTNENVKAGVQQKTRIGIDLDAFMRHTSHRVPQSGGSGYPIRIQHKLE